MNLAANGGRNESCAAVTWPVSHWQPGAAHTMSQKTANSENQNTVRNCIIGIFHGQQGSTNRHGAHEEHVGASIQQAVRICGTKILLVSRHLYLEVSLAQPVQHCTFLRTRISDDSGLNINRALFGTAHAVDCGPAGTGIVCWGNSLMTEQNFKYFPIQSSPISEIALIFGRFPGSARLSFWWEQHVDTNQYGSKV